MNKDSNVLDSCPISSLFDATSSDANVGMEASFEKLAEITNHIELHVRVDIGPWLSAELEELQASACEINGKLMEQLEISSVTSAHEVLEGDSQLCGQAYASAVRVLALHNTGQLQEKLEAASRWADIGPWEEMATDFG